MTEEQERLARVRSVGMDVFERLYHNADRERAKRDFMLGWLESAAESGKLIDRESFQEYKKMAAEDFENDEAMSKAYLRYII